MLMSEDCYEAKDAKVQTKLGKEEEAWQEIMGIAKKVVTLQVSSV